MKRHGIINLIAIVVVVLVVLNLLGVDISAILYGLVMLGLMLTGLRWIVTGRAPSGRALMLLALLFFGPTLLLTLLQIGVIRMRELPNPQALLLLLGTGGLLFWLARRWGR